MMSVQEATVGALFSMIQLQRDVQQIISSLVLGCSWFA